MPSTVAPYAQTTPPVALRTKRCFPPCKNPQDAARKREPFNPPRTPAPRGLRANTAERNPSMSTTTAAVIRKGHYVARKGQYSMY